MDIELLYFLFTVSSSVISMSTPAMYDCVSSNFPEAHREDSYCRQLSSHENPEPGCFLDLHSFGDSPHFRSCIIHCSGSITFGSREYRKCSSFCPSHLETYCQIIVTTTVNPPEIKASTQASVMEKTLSDWFIALAVVILLAGVVVTFLCLCYRKCIDWRKKRCTCTAKESAIVGSPSQSSSQAQPLLRREDTNDSNLPKQEQSWTSDWLCLSWCKKEMKGEVLIEIQLQERNRSSTGSNGGTSQERQERVLGDLNSHPEEEQIPENEREQNGLNAEVETSRLACNGNVPPCNGLTINANTAPNASNSGGDGSTDRLLQGTDRREEQVTSFSRSNSGGDGTTDRLLPGTDRREEQVTSFSRSNSGGDGTTDRLLQGTDRAEEQVASFGNVSNNNSSATNQTAQGGDKKDQNPLYVDITDVSNNNSSATNQMAHEGDNKDRNPLYVDLTNSQ